MSEASRRQAEEAVRDIAQAIAESKKTERKHGATIVARMHDQDAQAQRTQANARTEAMHRKNMDVLLTRAKKILRSEADRA